MSRVLLVDDSLEMVGGLTMILSAAGHCVQSAPCGRVALDMIPNIIPPSDCVVLDHIMPGMMGVEFLAKLRECPGWKHVPVIIVTGMGPNAISGMDLDPYLPAEVMIKPFDPPALVKRVKELTTH